MHGLLVQNKVRQQTHLQGRPRPLQGGDNMVDLSVDLCGMHMENPVVPASGTFGFGKEFKDFYDINMLGV